MNEKLQNEKEKDLGCKPDEKNACSVCGISGVMGFCCSREDCPTRVTYTC